MIKSLINKLLPQDIKDVIWKWQDYRDLKQWDSEGKVGSPPHMVKQLIIQEYQNKYQVSTLVETGTYLGKMVYAQRKRFKKIISIELSEALYEAAKARFKPYPHIELKQGDSGIVLHSIVPQLDGPAIFWLDGHYSAGITAKGEKECPIYEELEAIFKSPYKHILLIDDARCFVGQNDYPTIEELTSFIKAKDPNYRIEVKIDTIVAVPN